MKTKTMQVKMQINPKMETEALLDLFDDIGEYTSFWSDESRGLGANMISRFLEEHKDIDTVRVRINSNGGDVFDGIAIRNLLEGSGKTIHVEVVGIAASIASVIATAGTKVTMHPTSQMMIHNCWSYCCGNADELRKKAEAMDTIMESIKIAYLNKAGSKLEADTLQKLLDDETYLTASQCKEYGLCDEIVGESEEEPEEVEATTEETVVNQAPEFLADVKEPLWFF